MAERFEGEAGARRLVDLLREQKMVRGSDALAEELSTLVAVKEVRKGDVLIEEGADDTDTYFILDGSFDIVIRGKRVCHRRPTWSDRQDHLASERQSQRGDVLQRRAEARYLLDMEALRQKEIDSPTPHRKLECDQPSDLAPQSYLFIFALVSPRT
jgi:hypothetical protein